MVKALIYKDATTRILRVVCLLAMCWVSLVYTVALMPISLDASGTNPLTVESSTTLASQALVINRRCSGHYRNQFGRNGDSGSPRRFPAANGVFPDDSESREYRRCRVDADHGERHWKLHRLRTRRQRPSDDGT